MEAEKKEKMNKMRERERERVIKEDDERVPEGDGVEMREETKAQEGRWRGGEVVLSKSQSKE